LIFARSRRPAYILAGVGIAVGLAFALAALLDELRGGEVALVLGLAAAAAAGLVAAVCVLIRVSHRPAGRVGFFRDRLVLLQGRTELRAQWDKVEVATLTVPQDWSSGRWPELSITDHLTVRLRNERPLEFRPAAFGLEPAGCRDLILRLRDQPELRERLPEFDSVLDLATRPVVSGELIKPRI
jgi:hypothetical protein